MRKQEFSVRRLMDELQTESDAYLMLENLRWGGAPAACPKCGEVGKCVFIEPKNGTDRLTRTGSASPRRVWRCKGCRKQFSVLTDTIFHGTKISIRTWLMVIFEVCAAKNSVSAWEIARKYEITNESAWHMLHRIRRAMEKEPLAGLFSGTVQADETWIGGAPKNRHRSHPMSQARRMPGERQGVTDKQPVLALVHYETREVRSVVVPNVTGETLLPAIREQADMARVWLQTDGARAYDVVAKETYDHSYADHSAGVYVNAAGAGTNFAEGYFSQLKRSLDGTHHWISREHMHRYLVQFDWLYSHCRETDSQRMRRLIGNVDGKRLSYRPLVGRV